MSPMDQAALRGSGRPQNLAAARAPRDRADRRPRIRSIGLLPGKGPSRLGAEAHPEGVPGGKHGHTLASRGESTLRTPVVEGNR